MKVIIAIITFLLSTSCFAQADYFQFVDRSGNNYLRFWSVSLDGQKVGTTDGYGRVKIGGNRRRAQVTLKQGNKTKNVTLQVDGSDGLKTVVVR